MQEYRHAAYNLTTGVIIITEGSGNQFKRHIAETNRLDAAFGFGKGRWLFAHGKDAEDKVLAKAGVTRKRG